MKTAYFVLFGVAFGTSLVSYPAATNLLFIVLYLGAISVVFFGSLYLLRRAFPILPSQYFGFTWIELGIVLIIVGMLSAIAIPKFDSVSRLNRYGATVIATGYEVELEPIGRHTFILKERFILKSGTRDIFDSDTLRLRAQSLKAVVESLLLRRLDVRLSCGRILPVSEIDGEIATSRMGYRYVQLSCPDSATLRLGPFPRDMFYEATITDSISREAFADTETLSWNIKTNVSKISFAYIKSPAHWLRPFLPDAVWVHSLPRTILLLLGATLTCIAVPVIVDRSVQRMASPSRSQSTSGTA
jgi:hypothetical protein